MRVLGHRARILRDDLRDFFDRARAAVDVRGPQLGRQQMPAAEHIERQVAVAIVVAVKEPAFLMAVQRVVGRVEIENDLLGRPCVRLQEEVDERDRDRRRVVALEKLGLPLGHRKQLLKAIAGVVKVTTVR